MLILIVKTGTELKLFSSSEIRNGFSLPVGVDKAWWLTDTFEAYQVLACKTG